MAFFSSAVQKKRSNTSQDPVAGSEWEYSGEDPGPTGYGLAEEEAAASTPERPIQPASSTSLNANVSPGVNYAPTPAKPVAATATKTPTGTTLPQTQLIPTSSTRTSTTEFTGTPPTLPERPELTRVDYPTTDPYTLPERPELPELALPQYDESRVASETQRNAALGINLSRRSLREAVAGLGNDPASKRMLEGALSQLGINIERTLEGARTSAQAGEEARVARESAPALYKWQAEITSLRDEYGGKLHAADANYQAMLNAAHQKYLGDVTAEGAIWQAKLQDRATAFEAEWQTFASSKKVTETSTQQFAQLVSPSTFGSLPGGTYQEKKLAPVKTLNKY